MKKISFAFLVFATIFLSGCKEEIDWDAPAPWNPHFVAKKINNSVQLHISLPHYYLNETALYPKQNYSKPDFFTVYISETGIENWKKYGDFNYFDNKNNIIEIEDLNENTPYYFKIVSVGKNNKKSESDPVMTVSGEINIPSNEFDNIMESRISYKYSSDKKLETYHRDYSWETNKSARSVFIQKIASQEEILIEIKSSSPKWSPKENKIVFLSENNSIKTNNKNGSTSLISIYDCEKDTIVRLTEQYFSFQCSWSHNGNWIVHTLKSPNSDEYNIWKVNVLTKENILIQGDIGGLDNLAISDDKSPRNPAFSYNDEEIIFSRKTRNSRYYPQNIFKVSSNGGNIEQITNSYWNDDLPIASKDGKYISFISNRTGELQTWLININTKELSQLTSE